jgi:hypothetical protein
MATTQNTYTGNGSNKLFSITFPYLDTADIDVFLNGTLQTVTTQYTFANATTIEFVTAPANGATVLLSRSTNDATLQATFFPGSSIKATDLNDNFDQVLFIAQETVNSAANQSTAGLQTQITAATNTANTAITTANSANATATGIAGTANTALTNANAAVVTANAASVTATNAQTTANAISATASSALSTANAAQTTANAALPIAGGTMTGNVNFVSTQPQVVKAWVNFDGTANTNLSGTYSQSGTVVTVTATAHGLIAGSTIYADITSGTGVDGTYTVASAATNTFTYNAGTSLTTSGNITLIRNTIRASYNVSSITDNAVGDYTVNFTTAMTDANYCITHSVGSTNSVDADDDGGAHPFTKTSSSARIYVGYGNSTGNITFNDYNQIDLAIFR